MRTTVRRFVNGDRPRRRAAGVELVPVTGDRVEVAYELWCAFIGSRSPEPMQLDRWGPGLPVLVDDAGRPVPPEHDADTTPAGTAQYERTPTEPGQAVRRALGLIAAGRDCGGFVAYRGEQPCGFTAYSVRAHPFLAGRDGAIDALFVVPGERGRGVGTRLVSAARDELRRLGIHSISVETPADERGARRFWTRIGWPEFGAVAYHYD